MSFKSSIKRHAPQPIRRLSRKLKRAVRQRLDAGRSRKEVFTNVYNTNGWGGEPGEIYSGPGSSGAAARGYINSIKLFIYSNKIKSVVDLGCGDFRIGKEIAASGVDYTGVDIVDAVIARNQELHGSRKVRFLVGDIVEDDLPEGELCLVREVFQHLSNAEIYLALLKMRKYKYVVITDYQPPFEKFIPNRDITHGRSTRIHKGSGLDLGKPPFNVKNVSSLWIYPTDHYLYNRGERLCSFLICMEDQAERLDPVYLD